MSVARAVAAAVVFGWLGMVLAISFVETPLKFRAPGVTLRIGLGIGRLVFRALNTIEVVLAAALLVAVVLDPPPVPTGTALAVPVAALVIQLVAIRPWLSRRSAAVLADRADGPRSHAHLAYLALELVKVIGLLVGGALLLAG